MSGAQFQILNACLRISSEMVLIYVPHCYFLLGELKDAHILSVLFISVSPHIRCFIYRG